MPSSSKIDKAARIAKNSIAMLASATIVKGGGLVVAVLVARYLGATALGIFAVIQSMSSILEIMIPLGQQDVLVRTIARDRSAMFNHWVNASMTSFLVAMGFSIGLVFIAYLKDFGSDTTIALYVTATVLPCAGLNLVAQSVLQGAERMEYQPVAAFIGRLLGLVLLWLLLAKGAGVWAAFVSRAIFQLTSLMILTHAIWLNIKRNNWPADWHPRIAAFKKSIIIALPFLIQRFLNEGLNRLNILILPMLVTLATVGFFNAANQISQTISMIISIVMLTVLPVFTRSFKKDREKTRLLSDQTLKFMLILIFPFTFLVTVAASKIIILLYGAGYEDSVPLLQLVIWSQVFIAADSVMKQNMIASDNEGAMVRRSALVLAVNMALTVTLGKLFGGFGIAAAVVMSSALLLALDIRFVTKHISKPNLGQVIGKPFVCAALAGIAAFAVKDQGLIITAVLACLVYALFLFIFKVFTGEEVFVFRQLFQRFLIRFTD